MANPFSVTVPLAKVSRLMLSRVPNRNLFQAISPQGISFCVAKHLQWTRSSSTNSNPPKDKLYRQITIEVKGHDRAVINSYQKFTTMAAEQLGIQIASISEPPRVITRKSLLKSVFIFKKHQHQYEIRTLFRVFEFKHLTESTALTFLEYIQRNLPEGMAMKVTKHEIQPFPEHLKAPAQAQSSTTTSSSPSQQISS